MGLLQEAASLMTVSARQNTNSSNNNNYLLTTTIGANFFWVFLCVHGAYTTIAHESMGFTLCQKGVFEKYFPLRLRLVCAKVSKIDFLVSIFFQFCLKLWLFFVPFLKSLKCWFSCLFTSGSVLLSEQIVLCHLCKWLFAAFIHVTRPVLILPSFPKPQK